MDPLISIAYQGDPCGTSGKREFKLDYDHAQALLQHQKAVEDQVQNIKHQLACNRVVNPSIDEAVRAAENAISYLRQHNDKIWSLIPRTLHTSATTAIKAQEVFSTPELLESILCHVGARELLDSMLVQRTWKDTILGSVKLLRKLGLASFEDQKYYSVFSERFQTQNPNGIPGGSYTDENTTFRWEEDSESSYWTYNHQPVCEDPTELDIMIRLSTQPSGGRIGERVRAMQIMHPPQRMIHGILRCKRFCSKRAETTVVSSSTSGLTLGDLVDQTRLLLDKLCQCGDAEAQLSVRLHLTEDDLVMKERRQLEQNAAEKRLVRKVEREKWTQERLEKDD